jgi:DNA (cytosine-5)-methyltransferase 1
MAFDTTQITSAENGSNPKPGGPCHPLAAGAHAPAIAFGWQNSERQGDSCSEHVTPTLDKSKTPAVAVRTAQTSSNGWGVNTDTAYTLDQTQGQAVATGMAVRRLTPIECERLQGVEDGWTLVPNKRGKLMADGPRYKMIGNSFARPCITWIGRQIERAESYALQVAA